METFEKWGGEQFSFFSGTFLIEEG